MRTRPRVAFASVSEFEPEHQLNSSIPRPGTMERANIPSVPTWGLKQYRQRQVGFDFGRNHSDSMMLSPLVEPGLRDTRGDPRLQSPPPLRVCGGLCVGESGTMANWLPLAGIVLTLWVALFLIYLVVRWRGGAG